MIFSAEAACITPAPPPLPPPSNICPITLFKLNCTIYLVFGIFTLPLKYLSKHFFFGGGGMNMFVRPFHHHRRKFVLLFYLNSKSKFLPCIAVFTCLLKSLANNLFFRSSILNM